MPSALAWTVGVCGWAVAVVAGCGGASFSGAIETDGASSDTGSPTGDGGALDPPIPDASSGRDGPSILDASFPDVGRGDGAGGDDAGRDATDSGGDGSAGGVRCGPSTSCSGQTPICCLGPSTGCAHSECGCETQLACASDVDCSGAASSCCIDQVKDSTCTGGHEVSSCQIVCLGGATHLCDPKGPIGQCPGKACSTDSGSLSKFGLPPGQGYGVCQ